MLLPVGLILKQPNLGTALITAMVGAAVFWAAGMRWWKFAIGFAAGLAPVILNTLEGLRATRAVLIDMGRSFKLSRAQQFWKILLPSALPGIFTGLRLGLMFALINVVGVEFLINFGGLGQLINDLAERFDHPAMYATIGFVILVSVVFFMSLERVERWLRPVA